MVWSRAATGPGATAQRLASLSSTSTPWRRSRSTVMSMWGSEGTGLPSWRTSTPSSKRAPASSSAETNCEDAEASMTTRPPRTDPVPSIANGNESPARHGHAQRAQRGEHLADRTLAHVGVAVEGDPAGGEAGDRRHEPHHGAGQAAVDLGVAVEAAGGDGPVVAGGVDGRAEGGQGRRHQRGVARAQGPPYDGGPVGDRGQHQRAVGQGLGAGQRDRQVDGRGRPWGRPVLGFGHRPNPSGRGLRTSPRRCWHRCPAAPRSPARSPGSAGRAPGRGSGPRGPRHGARR